MKSGLLTTILILVFSFPVLAASPGKMDISAREASQLIQKQAFNKDFVIIDVRTPGEYAQGHLKNSNLINYFDQDFPQKIAALDREKVYLIYCRSGNRSSRTVDYMMKNNFKTVYNMRGGILNWAGSKFPLEY